MTVLRKLREIAVIFWRDYVCSPDPTGGRWHP